MVKINMMCGKRNFGPDWVHIDMANMPHIDNKNIYLPECDFEDESVDLIYCSHGIAYFDREEIIPLLKAWKRVLKPGGVLRISTTDFNTIANMYVNNMAGWDSLLKFIGPLFGRMDVNGSLFYHKTVYDFISLNAVLQNVGFGPLRYYSHRLTEHPNTGNREDKYDDHSAAYINDCLISLNVECKA